MDAWIDRLATALDEDPLTDAETTRLLGSATGRGLAEGSSRDAALASALETLEGLMPDEPAEGSNGSEG